MTTSVALVGSTGSIGTQSIEVIHEANTKDPDRFTVESLGAYRSVELLAEQASRLRPRRVALEDASRAGELEATVPAGVEVLAGPGALAAIGGDADVVVNGVVGFAGLPVTLAALAAGRRLALANKESLVAGAPVVQRVRTTPGAEILPVDSEHCAIHQCLRSARDGSEVAKVILTASGGPFRTWEPVQLEDARRSDALAHPTWTMGPKITVDSSTLMNKGLEVIEAHELFGIDFGRIDVVVHPQSIIHSMVEFTDGAVVAQLSEPDMRLPIGYCLGWPQRLTVPFGAIDWTRLARLEFEQPRRDVFRCLDLAYEAGAAGGIAPAWLNAANEVAVEAFLSERIGWKDIAEICRRTLDACDGAVVSTVEEVVDADISARVVAARAVQDLSRSPADR